MADFYPYLGEKKFFWSFSEGDFGWPNYSQDSSQCQNRRKWLSRVKLFFLILSSFSRWATKIMEKNLMPLQQSWNFWDPTSQVPRDVEYRPKMNLRKIFGLIFRIAWHKEGLRFKMTYLMCPDCNQVSQNRPPKMTKVCFFFTKVWVKIGHKMVSAIIAGLSFLMHLKTKSRTLIWRYEHIAADSASARRKEDRKSFE